MNALIITLAVLLLVWGSLGMSLFLVRAIVPMTTNAFPPFTKLWLMATTGFSMFIIFMGGLFHITNLISNGGNTTKELALKQRIEYLEQAQQYELIETPTYRKLDK